MASWLVNEIGEQLYNLLEICACTKPCKKPLSGWARICCWLNKAGLQGQDLHIAAVSCPNGALGDGRHCRGSLLVCVPRQYLHGTMRIIEESCKAQSLATETQRGVQHAWS